MANRIIQINSESLAKLITIHSVGILSMVGCVKLNITQIKMIKKATQIDIENGNYKQSDEAYNKLINA